MKGPMGLYAELKKMGIERPNEFLAAEETLATGEVKIDLMKLDDWALENGMKEDEESLSDFCTRKGANVAIITECF